MIIIMFSVVISAASPLVKVYAVLNMTANVANHGLAGNEMSCIDTDTTEQREEV